MNLIYLTVLEFTQPTCTVWLTDTKQLLYGNVWISDVNTYSLATQKLDIYTSVNKNPNTPHHKMILTSESKKKLFSQVCCYPLLKFYPSFKASGATASRASSLSQMAWLPKTIRPSDSVLLLRAAAMYCQALQICTGNCCALEVNQSPQK